MSHPSSAIAAPNGLPISGYPREESIFADGYASQTSDVQATLMKAQAVKSSILFRAFDMALEKVMNICL